MRKNKIRYTLRKKKNPYTALSNRLERLRKKAARAAVQTQRVLDRDKWSYERKLIARINGIRLRLFPRSNKGVGYYYLYVQSSILSNAAGFNWYIRNRETDLEYYGITGLRDLLHDRAKTERNAALYLNFVLDLENEVTCGELPDYIYNIGRKYD